MPIKAGESRKVVKALEENARDLSEKAINFWFEESQLWLEQAAHNRANIASEGRIGRENNGLFAIQQQATPPAWNNGHWEFSYNHEGAVFQEYGARPHEITARRAEFLAFEWPDAPEEVQEQFDHTEGDLVFFKSINHPGIPAIGFTRRGRDKLIDRLEAKGIDTRKL
jgi:hypothetical protein